MQVITTSQLAAYLRQPVTELDAAASSLYVELANGIVTEVTGELDPVPVRVRAIALEVAARAYRNPEGVTSETIDDYTWRRGESTSGAGVYLTPDEYATLARLSGGTGRVTSVRLMSPFDDTTPSSELPTP